MRSRLRRYLDCLPPWAWPSRQRRVESMLRSARKWQRKHPPKCYRCGFDLTGSRNLGACPECGRPCAWEAHWARDGRWPIWMPALTVFAGPMLVLLWWSGMRIAGELTPSTTVGFDFVLLVGTLGFLVIPAKLVLLCCGLAGSTVRTRRFRSLGPRVSLVLWVYGGALVLFWLGAEVVDQCFPLD